MIGPYFEELAGKFPGVVFVKVDVDDLDDVAAECGISAMPTFQLYSNGVKVEELTGADKGKLEAPAKTADDLGVRATTKSARRPESAVRSRRANDDDAVNLSRLKIRTTDTLPRPVSFVT